MYAGRVVEEGLVSDLFAAPGHPYTAGLINSTPSLDQAYGEAMTAIPGQPPNLQRLPTGCAFRKRCRYEIDACREMPELRAYAQRRNAACFRAGNFSEVQP